MPAARHRGPRTNDVVVLSLPAAQRCRRPGREARSLFTFRVRTVRDFQAAAKVVLSRREYYIDILMIPYKQYFGIYKEILGNLA